MASIILFVYMWVNLFLVIILFIDRVQHNPDLTQKITFKQIGTVFLTLFFGVFILLYDWLKSRRRVKNDMLRKEL